MPQFPSFPTGQIADQHTRAAIDKLMKFCQDLSGNNGFASQSDITDLRRLIGSNATSSQRTTITRIVTPDPTPTPDGDFVARSGDIMSGRLGITIDDVITDGTSEAHGITNTGSTSHERANGYFAPTTYVTGEMVAYGGLVWVSIQNANTGNTPATGSAWWRAVAVDMATWIKEAYNAANDYALNDTVTESSVIWTCIQAHTSASPKTPHLEPTYWSIIDDHIVNGPTYAVGDVCRYDVGIFTSLQASNVGHRPVPPAWTVGKTYGAADQVYYLGVLYTSLSNGNVGNQPNLTPLSWLVATANIWWSGQAPVTVGIQSNAFAKRGNGFGYTFGIACEAWNGEYPTTGTLGVATDVDRTLIAIEPAVINRNPRSTQAKVAGDFTFKNRADTEYYTAMPLGSLGENRYNRGARATQYSSFPRSPTGEYCGWPTLRKVAANAFDISDNQPYSVLDDIYDASTDQAGQDVWWLWWATGLNVTALQPLGSQGGVRFSQAQARVEWHGDIGDGTKIAGWLNVDNPYVDYTLALPVNYDYINKGTLWKGLQVFDGSGDAIVGTSGCVQFNGQPNFNGSTAATAGAVFTYINVLVGGVAKKIAVLNV